MVNIKLSKREIDDLQTSLEYAVEDYCDCLKRATSKEDEVLYEARIQRSNALARKLSAAQEKAQ